MTSQLNIFCMNFRIVALINAELGHHFVNVGSSLRRAHCDVHIAEHMTNHKEQFKFFHSLSLLLFTDFNFKCRWPWRFIMFPVYMTCWYGVVRNPLCGTSMSSPLLYTPWQLFDTQHTGSFSSKDNLLLKVHGKKFFMHRIWVSEIV
jgi:hypothetical protein